MLRKASTKTPTRTFQFSENFRVVVFLVTIKHYLLQVFEERNLSSWEDADEGEGLWRFRGCGEQSFAAPP